MQNPAVRQYIRRTRRQLICSRRWKRHLTRELIRTTELFLTECPDASLEELCDALGEPEKFAEELLMQIPAEEKLRWQRNSGRLSRAVIGGLVVTIICLEVVHMQQPVRLPKYWDYAAKYGLGYEYGPDGRIERVTDRDGNTVEVDRAGIPLDHDKYFLTEEERTIR